MTHHIAKNKNKSSNRQLKLLFFKKKIKHNVSFDNSCKYNFNDIDQYDINKLFGFSFGFHHKNSARFGWRWDVDKNKLEILAYIYRDGKRIKEWEENIKICHLEPLENVEMKIKVENGHYIFSVKKLNLEYSLKIKHGKLRFWGYYLNPYFGGNKKAPHDMIITLN